MPSSQCRMSSFVLTIDLLSLKIPPFSESPPSLVHGMSLSSRAPSARNASVKHEVKDKKAFSEFSGKETAATSGKRRE